MMLNHWVPLLFYAERDDDLRGGSTLIMRLSIALTMLLCSSLWAADFHALDVKTGQWETTVTGQMTGMPAIPAEALAHMTPEQRDKVESAMGARGAKPIVSSNCMTKEKLDQAWNAGQNLKNCTFTATTSSSSKQEARLECNQNGTNTSGTIKVEVVDSEHIRGSFQMTAASSDTGHTMNMNYSFLSKWVGAACTEAK
jgi:hypothetical protein